MLSFAEDSGAGEADSPAFVAEGAVMASLLFGSLR